MGNSLAEGVRQLMEITIGIVVALMVGILMLFIRSMSARMTDMEKNYMNKRDIRELIEDKVGGIRDDVIEIKERINDLFELYMRDHTPRK